MEEGELRADSDWKRSLRWETGVNKNAHCGVRLRNWHRKGKGTVRLEPSWLRIYQSASGLSASKENVHAVRIRYHDEATTWKHTHG